MQFTYRFLLCCLIFSLSACGDKSGNAKSLPAEKLYGTYTFTIDDTRDEVSCLFQFGKQKNGKGLYLPAGSSISFDGQNLTGDSISIGEVYYETQIPSARLAGDHVVLLKDETGKVFKEDVDIQPVFLASQIPGKLKRADLVFIVKGVTEFDKIQLALIDTAFATNDFHLDTVTQTGKLPVARNRLNAVAGGPLTIYLMVEKRRLLRGDLNGEVVIRYIFRRETELVD